MNHSNGDPQPATAREAALHDQAGTGAGTDAGIGAGTEAGFEVLGRSDCVKLLKTVSVGRIAVTSRGLPEIHPVIYQVDDDHIVFCTSSHNQLAAATHDAIVAFEADDLDEACRIGWSVMVTGRASQVTDPRRLARLRGLAMTSLSAAQPDEFIQISLEMVTGRRVLQPAR